MSWEDTFSSWAKPPSTTEAQKCENAEAGIRKAIEADSELAKHSIRVFTQGSYRANTNVRLDSDVDICVLCTDVFYPDYPSDGSYSGADLLDATLSYSSFKTMVGEALRKRFGSTGVTRGNKAFDVHSNSYRVDADVVAAFEHRRYVSPGQYHSGIAFNPDSGGRIVNWPEQTAKNGIEKNLATGKIYKQIVRILKRLRNAMQEDGITASESIESFLIECLVWNCPNSLFQGPTYTAVVREVLTYLWQNTRELRTCNDWGEVNELKYLFRGSPASKLSSANAFLLAAWQYVGYK